MVLLLNCLITIKNIILLLKIVHTDETASKVIKLLKENKLGRVTFMPLNRIKEKQLMNKIGERTTFNRSITNVKIINNIFIICINSNWLVMSECL